MTNLWRARTFICLLLVVSTIIGTSVPVRACVCFDTAANTFSSRTIEAANDHATVAKSFCPSNLKNRSCCGPTSNCSSTDTSCCGSKLHALHAKNSLSTAVTIDLPSCHCLQCDCTDFTQQVPAFAAPANELGNFAVVSVASPVFALLRPNSASKVVRPISANPPIDLVISLSRLLC